MDDAKATEVLEWWILHATAAMDPGYTFGRVGPAMNALREREDQTRRVIATVNGVTQLPAIMTTLGGDAQFIHVGPGIELAKYALDGVKLKKKR